MRPIIYTALGDSLSVGTIPLINNSFVPKYAKILETHFQRRLITVSYGKKE